MSAFRFFRSVGAMALGAFVCGSAGAASDDAASAQHVVLQPSSPYYVAALKLETGKQIAAGTVIGGCTINAYAKCPNAKLANQKVSRERFSPTRI